MPDGSRPPLTAEEIADRVGEGMYARDFAAHALGISLQEIRPGYARMTMRVREDMANGHAIGHGGLTFTLADTAFAYACNSYNGVAVAQSANITFLSPARLGEMLTAVAEEQSRTRRSGVYDVTVTAGDGRRVALFRGLSARLGSQVVEGLTEET